ncbi:MAG TPA: hypothetical protein VI913_04720 [Candidatus Peribacteraceae bacterium]|nr:hypothetical protein [Candidatus Peribacteraceae bacterium]
MDQNILTKPLPQDVTLGILLVILLASSFLIVLPRLQALRELPEHYYSLLPVATQGGDIDRDGIPDGVDSSPYGESAHGSAGR